MAREIVHPLRPRPRQHSVWPSPGPTSTASDPLVAEAGIRFVLLLANLGLIAEARRHDERLLADDGPRHLRPGQAPRRPVVPRRHRGRLERLRARPPGLALEHLTPGDGAWSGAIGLTSIPLQMFVPADIVPVLVDHRAELDGLDGTGADVDRATIDFYLGGALLNLRRFDEGTDGVPALGGDHGGRSSRPASSVCGRHRAPRSARRSADVPKRRWPRSTRSPTWRDWTDWAVEWAFARAFALAHCGPIADARAPLAAIGARFGTDHPSPLAGTVVAGFGVLAALEGDTARATELLGWLTATRSAASTAAAYEVLGRMEGWTDDEFANRKVERVIDGGRRGSRR